MTPHCNFCRLCQRIAIIVCIESITALKLMLVFSMCYCEKACFCCHAWAICQLLFSFCFVKEVSVGKASIRVPLMIRLFAQVAHVAGTAFRSCCHSGCEKTGFSRGLTHGCQSAGSYCPLCSLTCLGKRCELDYVLLEKPGNKCLAARLKNRSHHGHRKTISESLYRDFL